MSIRKRACKFNCVLQNNSTLLETINIYWPMAFTVGKLLCKGSVLVSVVFLFQNFELNGRKYLVWGRGDLFMKLWFPRFIPANIT